MVIMKNPDSNRRGFSLTVFNQGPSVCLPASTERSRSIGQSDLRLTVNGQGYLINLIDISKIG